VSERQLQFRVGLFVLASLAIGTVLILQFGEMQSFFETRYAIAIQFDEAPGVERGVPVRQNGLDIGSVVEVRSGEQGGVLVVVEIKEDVTLRRDAQPALKRSLFGDASIVFPFGTSREPLPPNSQVRGLPPQDPLQIVERLDTKVQETLTAFEETSREWQQVAANVNSLIDTKQGSLDDVVERAAASLEQFTLTMQTAHQTLGNANRLLEDPHLQQSLKATMNALPQMVEETRGTIAAARFSIEKIGATADSMNATLANMNRMTDPLAKATPSIVTKLDASLGQLDTLLRELTTITMLVNQGDGTISKLATDPELYDNLNRSAATMPVVLSNLSRIAADLRVFSDKIARHPELLGARGVIRGSDGLKDVPHEGQPIRRTGFTQPEHPGR
jgi:phospholipid/cholesterol/gamma-HCH transport system substrate-binding protein